MTRYRAEFPILDDSRRYADLCAEGVFALVDLLADEGLFPTGRAAWHVEERPTGLVLVGEVDVEPLTAPVVAPFLPAVVAAHDGDAEALASMVEAFGVKHTAELLHLNRKTVSRRLKAAS